MLGESACTWHVVGIIIVSIPHPHVALPLSLPPSLTHPLFILYSTYLLLTIALAIELVQIAPTQSEGAEVIHTVEDSSPDFDFRVTGYSYGSVGVQVSILTYSEYAARGFNLSQDEFDASVIPINAADGMLCDVTETGMLLAYYSPLVSEFQRVCYCSCMHAYDQSDVRLQTILLQSKLVK